MIVEAIVTEPPSSAQVSQPAPRLSTADGRTLEPEIRGESFSRQEPRDPQSDPVLLRQQRAAEVVRETEGLLQGLDQDLEAAKSTQTALERIAEAADHIGAPMVPRLEAVQRRLQRKSRAIDLRHGRQTCATLLQAQGIPESIRALPLKAVVEGEIRAQSDFAGLLCNMLLRELDVRFIAVTDRSPGSSLRFELRDETRHITLFFSRRAVSRTWFLSDIQDQGRSRNLSYADRTQRLLEFLTPP